MNFLEGLYKPDILDCIANLSSDEVFTPPKLVNEILDTLPQELFKSPDTKFLDPCCKSGVFLREIAKRLNEGLKDKIPNLQDRIDHIFKNQLFGLAITELTGLFSRRSLYCSKNASGKCAVSEFSVDDSYWQDAAEGNILGTSYIGKDMKKHRINHSWGPKNNTTCDSSCLICGASAKQWNKDDTLENHAYSFIHCSETKNEELFKRLKEMKFDVIIGNPPYQLSFGLEGTNSSNAKSIYNLFISQAIKLNPRYITMITPSRWMTRTSQGIPDDWVDRMLSSNKFKVIHDYENSSDCFPGVEIKGGVNYFLWDRDYTGICEYVFHTSGNDQVETRNDYLDSKGAGVVVRNPKAYKILDKVIEIEGDYFSIPEHNFSGLVSPKHFFDNSFLLTSNWDEFEDNSHDEFNIKYYLNKNIHKKDYGWISSKQLPKNQKTKDLHKIYIPAAGGSGTDSQILGTPFYGEPNSVCSQTYLVIGYNPELHHFTKEQCEHIIGYIKTRFFRYLVSIKKKTQNGPRGVYQFVPLQDFNEEWTDEKLYKKYNLSQKEIDFIESMIKPME